MGFSENHSHRACSTPASSSGSFFFLNANSLPGESLSSSCVSGGDSRSFPSCVVVISSIISSWSHDRSLVLALVLTGTSFHGPYPSSEAWWCILVNIYMPTATNSRHSVLIYVLGRRYHLLRLVAWGVSRGHDWSYDWSLIATTSPFILTNR